MEDSSVKLTEVKAKLDIIRERIEKVEPIQKNTSSMVFRVLIAILMIPIMSIMVIGVFYLTAWLIMNPLSTETMYGIIIIIMVLYFNLGKGKK